MKLKIFGKDYIDLDNNLIWLNSNNDEVKEWLLTNTPEPEFTEEELVAIENNKAISEAKQYLADTDYKVLPDYDGDTTGIIEARAEARALIRQLEGSNING